MKPLPTDRPVVWGDDEPSNRFIVAAAEVPLADFERRWGPAHQRDADGDGWGPTRYWGWRADCGFKFVVAYLEVKNFFQVIAREDELDHALAHLDWWRGEVVWRLDADEPRAKDGWAVYRQDDTGNRHDVCVMGQRSHAECLARRLEARAHKQWYAVEARGTPPVPPPRPREGWAVVRQDEHGNRAEVAVFSSETRARELAAAYDAEPRHKQAYFVEHVPPES
ncbi:MULTISPECIES: hypothetical protein [Myxococcus]|uniref:hypothetical protein n=1 Tax=Myxococcus TaxID=32 RepID=UPI0011416364|nr:MULTISPECIES: hypothetical protein [Myxococcus]MCK8499791.1 hypothetical protein [Myxococcus fulvus]